MNFLMTKTKLNNMALSENTKDKAQKALDNGNLIALLALIFKFGMELLEFISDRIQERKNAQKQ